VGALQEEARAKARRLKEELAAMLDRHEGVTSKLLYKYA